MSRCVPLATEYAPSPSLIWIDPRPCDPMRIWMRPIPARCRSAAPSPLGDPCVTVGAAEEVHPLPTANAHRDGRRPPSRPPYGRRLAADRAPPSKIEAHHAALPLLASSGLALTFQGDSGRFREIQIWIREIQISLESGGHTISFEMLRPTSCASSERLGASPHPAPKPIS